METSNFSHYFIKPLVFVVHASFFHTLKVVVDVILVERKHRCLPIGKKEEKTLTTINEPSINHYHERKNVAIEVLSTDFYERRVLLTLCLLGDQTVVVSKPLETPNATRHDFSLTCTMKRGT